MSVQQLLGDQQLAPVWAALPNARVVGGAVRDALAGLSIADIDLATPEPPEDSIRALIGAGLKVVPTGLAHGTVTAISGGHPFEITTLRRDVGTDGRHATVEWTGDWREDAARRDFTINAMSLGRDGVVYDYFGGRADLAARRVRFVGDAAARIAEDYLRILRFFRFYARYGGGAPDAEAMDAIRNGVHGLAILSAERVWSELKRIFAAPDPAPSVHLMERLGVLPAVIPEVADPPALDRLLAAGAPSDPILRVAALLGCDAASFAARLKLSGAEAERLAALRRGPVPRPEDDDDALRRLLADEEAELLIGRSWLAGGGAAWDALRARLAALPRPVFPLEGRDALALGAKPGPAVGEALRQVRAWWKDRGCHPDRAACAAELHRFFQESPASN